MKQEYSDYIFTFLSILPIILLFIGTIIFFMIKREPLSNFSYSQEHIGVSTKTKRSGNY